MEQRLRRVIFTCGGTAGHVNPAIALAQLMHEKDPATEFLFVGAERGLEKDLIPKAGYAFRTVHISSFHRSFRPAEIRHNLISVCNLMRAPREARAILREFSPDVVVGTGGYASFPIVKAAAKAGIPTAVHESNMTPGLTSRVLEAAGGAAVLLEQECSGQKLFQTACGILHDEARRAGMASAMASLGVRDATERIYQAVTELIR